MKKYTTDWKMLSAVILIPALLFIIIVLSAPRTGQLPAMIVLISFGFGFLTLLCTKYSYAVISGTTLKFVYLLFQRRTTDISSITEINNQPTFKVLHKSARSVYIFYKIESGEIKYIELRVTIFPAKTIGLLIRDLKQINPNIKLDAYSEGLMKKAE